MLDNAMSGGHELGFERYRNLLLYIEGNMLLPLYRKAVMVGTQSFPNDSGAAVDPHGDRVRRSRLLECCLVAMSNVLRFPYMITLREFHSESYLARLDDISVIMISDPFQDNVNLGERFFEQLLAVCLSPNTVSEESLHNVWRVLAFVPALRKSVMKVPPLSRTAACFCLRAVKAMTHLGMMLVREKTPSSLTAPNTLASLRGSLLDCIHRLVRVYTLESLLEHMGPVALGNVRVADLPVEFSRELRNQEHVSGFDVLVKDNLIAGLWTAWQLLWFEAHVSGTSVLEFCKENYAGIIETWKQIFNIISDVLSPYQNWNALRRHIPLETMIKSILGTFFEGTQGQTYFCDLAQALWFNVQQIQTEVSEEQTPHLSEFSLLKQCSEIQELVFSFQGFLDHLDKSTAVVVLLPVLKSLSSISYTAFCQSVNSKSYSATGSQYWINCIAICSFYQASTIKLMREKDCSHSPFGAWTEHFPHVPVQPDFEVKHPLSVSPFSVEVIPDDFDIPSTPTTTQPLLTSKQADLAVGAFLGSLNAGSLASLLRLLSELPNGHPALPSLELAYLMLLLQLNKSLNANLEGSATGLSFSDWAIFEGLQQVWEPRVSPFLVESWIGGLLDTVVHIMTREGQSQTMVVLAGACLQNCSGIVKSKIPIACWRETTFFKSLVDKIRGFLNQEIDFTRPVLDGILRARSEFYSVIAILILNDRLDEYLEDSKNISNMMFEMGDKINPQVLVKSFHLRMTKKRKRLF